MSSIENASGVEISTTSPKNSESAVADAPIIIFITSQIALRFNSFNSNSSSGISVIIRISTMDFTSFLFKSITFVPSKPATYVICTPIAGSKFVNLNSSAVRTCTLGVVISTLLLSIVDTAVADAPKLIFSISPMASISNGLKRFELISFLAPSINHLFFIYSADFYRHVLILNTEFSFKPWLVFNIEIDFRIFWFV